MLLGNKMYQSYIPHIILSACCVAALSVEADSYGIGESNRNEIADTNRKYDQVQSQIKRIRGIAVTGVNSIRGKPIFDWGEPFGIFGFPTLFAYNESGNQPLSIDDSTPNSAVLATGVSPEYLLSRGETSEVVKPEWINVPLRQIPVNVGFNYDQKLPLPGLLDASPLELTQAEPAEPITLGQWLSANGSLTIDCSGEHATVKLRVRNLIPNRIYSLWATLQLPQEVEGKPGQFSTTLPIGGTPNIFVTDGGGDAVFERKIKFCPFKTQPSLGSLPVYPVLNMGVVYHADHETYGAIPAPGINPNLGLISFSHLVFPIDVEMLRQ